MALGIHVGALDDEVVDAVVSAMESRVHEGRIAVLRRRGGGARHAVSGGGERGAAQGRRVARAEGEGRKGLMVA